MRRQSCRKQVRTATAIGFGISLVCCAGPDIVAAGSNPGDDASQSTGPTRDPLQRPTVGLRAWQEKTADRRAFKQGAYAEIVAVETP